jgi:hypothetical protein
MPTPTMVVRMPEKPLLGITALGHQVYVYMRNGQRRPVPEAELITVIVEYLDTHDVVIQKDGFRARYGVEEILPNA